MIPTQDFINAPYDDTYLIYNRVFHRYVINLNYFIEAIGDDTIITKLGGNDNAQWILDHTSEVTYSVIDSYTDSKYRDKMRYYFSHSKRIREWLIKTMRDVLIYDDADGGVYTAYATGINFNEMKAFDMILTNYIGRMAQQIMINGGLAERIPRFDLDRVTSQFSNKHDLLEYMALKGYIDINKYYHRVTINSNGSGFVYQDVRELFDASRYVAIKSPITFDTDRELSYITEELNNNDITFTFEEGEIIILQDNDTINGSSIQDTTFYIDFTLENGMPLIPNSTKYMVSWDSNRGYYLYELGLWQTIMSEKGANW